MRVPYSSQSFDDPLKILGGSIKIEETGTMLGAIPQLAELHRSFVAVPGRGDTESHGVAARRAKYVRHITDSSYGIAIASRSDKPS